MKTVLIIAASILALTLPTSYTVKTIPSELAPKDSIKKSQVNFHGFMLLSEKIYHIRNKSLVTIDSFIALAKDSNTIILDTRSKQAYDHVHITGAKHLDLTDFTLGALQKAIPDTNTRILIYCNNNFITTFDFQHPDTGQAAMLQQILAMEAMAMKQPPLALNIPTFVNLYSYGYHNIFEMNATEDLFNTTLHLSGTTTKDGKVIR